MGTTFLASNCWRGKCQSLVVVCRSMFCSIILGLTNRKWMLIYYSYSLAERWD